MNPPKHPRNERDGQELQGAEPRDPDALDLLAHEDQLLGTLLARWHAGDAENTPDGNAVTENWDQGTVGKLLLEHGAVRLAAAHEVRDALGSAGHGDLARQVGNGCTALGAALDQMDQLSRGVNGVALASTAGFPGAVDALAHALPSSPLPFAEIRRALGDRALHRPAFVRAHAPTHPGPPRWYDHVAPLVRLHTVYDRLRGFPWATNGPYTDAELADRLEEDEGQAGGEG